MKLPLACYRATVVSECLTMLHQFTVKPELPIMNLLLSNTEKL